MSKTLQAALAKLIEHPEGLPASALTPAQRKVLEAWGRNTGAMHATPSGRGVIYKVRDSSVLNAHLQSLRPHSQDALPASLPQRAANIALARNSKGRAHSHSTHYLLLKSVGDHVIWRNAEGRMLHLAEATATAGVGALAVQADDTWHSEQPLWLVENQALFDHLDWFPQGQASSIAYYAGQLNGKLLEWLASQARTPKLVLFPDYDGVGLQNFARLKKLSITPPRLWMIPKWRELLQTYGSASLWQNTRLQFEAASQALLHGALESDTENEWLELIQAMRETGLALEQEVVWMANHAAQMDR